MGYMYILLSVVLIDSMDSICHTFFDYDVHLISVNGACYITSLKDKTLHADHRFGLIQMHYIKPYMLLSQN